MFPFPPLSVTQTSHDARRTRCMDRRVTRSDRPTATEDRIVSYMHSLGLEMHDAEHFFDIIADHCQDWDIIMRP